MTGQNQRPLTTGTIISALPAAAGNTPENIFHFGQPSVKFLIQNGQSPAYLPIAGRNYLEDKLMRSRTRLFTIIALLGTSIALLSPVRASAAAGLPITGTFTDASGGTGVFTGTLNPQGFGVKNGTLVLTGTLVGTLMDHTGALLGTITSGNVALPVGTPSGSTCQILNLTLGPLHLNLLGLVVNLNQVHLTINAVSGPGNLLGNLLCAVANLLNGGAPDLGTLSTLLNRILLAL